MKSAVWGFFSLLLATPAHAGWIIDDGPIGPDLDSVVIVYKQQGGTSLREALAQLMQSGRLIRLKHLTLHSLVNEQPLQSELVMVLERLVPEQVARAKASASKIHELKLGKARGAFSKAVLAVPTVVGITHELDAVGLRVTQVDYEKLILAPEENEQQLVTALWLLIAPKPK